MTHKEISQLVKRSIIDLTGSEEKEIISSRRFRRLVESRYVAFKILSDYTKMSLEEIGSQYGFRDHSTVINGRDQLTDWIERNDKAAQNVIELHRRVKLIVEGAIKQEELQYLEPIINAS